MLLKSICESEIRRNVARRVEALSLGESTRLFGVRCTCSVRCERRGLSSWSLFPDDGPDLVGVPLEEVQQWAVDLVRGLLLPFTEDGNYGTDADTEAESVTSGRAG